MFQFEYVPNSNAVKLNLCLIPWSKYENIGKIGKILKYCRNFESESLDLGTIQFDSIGIRHNSIWRHWNKAQFNLMVLE